MAHLTTVQHRFIGEKLKLGLCCINTILREQKPPVFCSRTCVRKNFTVESAKEKALQNVKDIATMIEWNEANNIKCFRLSSDMFPHFTDTDTEKYTIDFASEELKKAGDLAKKYGHRICMHPGQYNQVGTKTQSVFDKTVEDLKHHANILDKMGIDENGVLIVHGGGVFGNKEETIERWISQFQLLPENVKKRLVIENCERQYSIEDCLKISKRCNIPVVFDFHHYNCWSLIYGEKQRSLDELMPEIIASWGDRRILMHISDQADDKKIGSHHDFVETIPDDLFNAIIKYNVSIDLEIEAKMKEQAIFKLYNKYPYMFKQL